MWIGARANFNSSFEWSDHSPLDFVNWAKGEPNDNFGEYMFYVHLIFFAILHEIKNVYKINKQSFLP